MLIWSPPSPTHLLVGNILVGDVDLVTALPHGPAHQLNAWLIEAGVPQHLTNVNSIYICTILS
jgi:hypothetical protein